MKYWTTLMILTFASCLIKTTCGAPLNGDADGAREVKDSRAAGGVDKDTLGGKNKENTIFGLGDAVNYLKKYGYLPDDVEFGEAQTRVDPTSALKEFQQMFGIDITGVLDEATKKEMMGPRCGVKDVDLGNPDRGKRREKRYSYQGSRWRNSRVTYHISTYTTDLSQAVVDEQVRKAFDTWQEHIPLTFVEVNSWEQPDITILFASYGHGDGIPFDGRGRTLAHAFFPQFGGDAHFDDSETFTAYRSGGVDTHMVVAHELGHSIGLGHSSQGNALMAPSYKGYKPNFSLHADDIRGAQFLYGRRTTATTTRSPAPSILPSVVATPATPPPPAPPRNTTPRTTRPTQPTENVTPEVGRTPNFCDATAMDAMTNYEGKTFGFRGSYYAELNRYGILPGFPKLISSGWPGLPDNVDATLRWEAEYDYERRGNRYVPILRSQARTYFFKGRYYWRYDDGSGLRSGYPRLISSGFPGVPNDLDAAFAWGEPGEDRPWTILVKGTNYYRYTRAVGVNAGYPRPLSDWVGLPSTIDAAFRWSSNAKNYFFSGSSYYRSSTTSKSIDEDYPRPTSFWWFGCPPDFGMWSNLEIDGSENKTMTNGEWPEVDDADKEWAGGKPDAGLWEEISGSDNQAASGGQDRKCSLSLVLIVMVALLW